MNSVSFKLLIRKDFVTQLSCQALGFVPQIQWAEISLCSAACCGVGDGDWENLSQLFQDYYSAVTSHFTHSGDRELAGRRAAKGLCRIHTHMLRTFSIFDSGKSQSGR